MVREAGRASPVTVTKNLVVCGGPSRRRRRRGRRESGGMAAALHTRHLLHRPVIPNPLDHRGADDLHAVDELAVGTPRGRERVPLQHEPQLLGAERAVGAEDCENNDEAPHAGSRTGRQMGVIPPATPPAPSPPPRPRLPPATKRKTSFPRAPCCRPRSPRRGAPRFAW